MAESGRNENVLRSGRLVIRPWRIEDIDRLFEVHSRLEVVRWWGAQPMQSRSQAVALLERMKSRFPDDAQFGNWAIVERGFDVPAGTIMLKPLPDGNGEIEVGWHLHPDSWGRGLATEAAQAVLARGFAEGLSEVWAVTDPQNERSIAVCRRIGMRLLGVTHRWYHEPSLMFWVGSHRDQEPSLQPDEPASHHLF
jgi:RimJ/RimL family protein N-acetyltransferase